MRTVLTALGIAGTVVSLALAVASVPPAVSQQRDTHTRLFPPEQLGLLEAAGRDEWQEPQRVMDSLGIADGARVADIGAGGGWFTIRLAHRVGPNGVVYAEDIQPEMIESIRRRVVREGLTNVEPKLGTATDPQLPGGLNAVLMVDTYPQIPQPVVLLQRIKASLAPNGRLGIVDFKTDGAGGPGPDLEDRVSPETIKQQAAAAGLKLLSHETYLKYQYLLVFVK
jgi:ubiquinone/menaquinone biosynthesis C-methylase UbiE